MMKRIVLYSIIVLILGAWFYFGYYADIRKTGIQGIVSKRPYDYWGIESDQWYKSGKFSVKNLPKEFQQEGKRVKCNAVFYDVIGDNEWDTYIEVNNCVTLN